MNPHCRIGRVTSIKGANDKERRLNEVALLYDLNSFAEKQKAMKDDGRQLGSSRMKWAEFADVGYCR